MEEEIPFEIRNHNTVRDTDWQAVSSCLQKHLGVRNNTNSRKCLRSELFGEPMGDYSAWPVSKEESWQSSGRTRSNYRTFGAK